MAQYDGSIRINTSISTKDAKVQLSALQHTIVKTADEIASLRSRMDALKDVKVPTQEYKDLQKELADAEKEMENLAAQDSKLADIDAKIKKLSQSSAEYAAKMKEAAEQKIPTEQYATYEKSLTSAENKLSELYKKQERFLATGGKEDSSTYKKMVYDAERLEKKISGISKAMELLEKRGEAFTPGIDTEQYKDLTEKYSQVNAELEKQKDMHSEIAQQQADAVKKTLDLKTKIKELVDAGADFKLGKDTDEYTSLSRQLDNEQKALAKMNLQYAALGGFEKLGKIKDSFKKLGEAAKRAFSKVDKSAKKSSGSISSFGSRLKGLAMSALIFNQVSKAFNSMFSGMKEGFGNLYNEVDGFKKSVNGLKASALTLKNSLAAAFRPLVEAAIPYIQKAIEYITHLVNSFGQLVAAITGQKTYTKAIKQTGAAFEEDAKAAEDAKEAAEGYLGPLDEVNKYRVEKNKDISAAGNDGAGGAGQMFEEVPVNSKFIEMANKIKEVLSQLFQPLKTAWENQGQFVMDSWKYALEEIGMLAKSVGHDFLMVWNQPETISVLENILIIVGDIGLVVGNLAARFREAWEANDVGLRILENIRNLFGIIIEHIRNAADATVEWSRNLDFSPMLESINSLLEALQPLADNIGAGLEWFYTNVLLPIAGWTIEDAIPVFLDMLSAAIGAVNEVIEALKPLGAWLWNEFLQPLGQWAGDTIIAAMQTITELLTKFGNWVSENQEAIMSITAIIGLFFASWKTVELMAFIQLSGGVVGALNQITTALVGATAAKLKDKAETMALTALYAKDFIVNLAKGTAALVRQAAQFAINTAAKIADTAAQVAMTAATTAWNAVCTIATAATTAFGAAVAFLTSPIGIAIAAIGAIIAVGVLLYKNWDTIKEKAGELKDWLLDKFGSIKDGISKAVEGIKAIVGVVWNNIFDVTKKIFANTAKAISDVISGIKNIFSGLVDFVSGIFTGNWKKAWEGVTKIFSGVRDAIKGVVNGILGFVGSLANGVVNAVNTVIRALNRLSFDIPDWIPLIGGNHFGFNIPELSQVSIPRLATGAVIPPNREFLAVLGDQKSGTNIEAPLDTIKQAQKESILEVLSELGLTGAVRGGNSQPREIVLKVDRRELGRVMIDEGNLQLMSTGKNMFMLGIT